MLDQAYAGDDPKVAAEIMALARAQWAAEVAGKSPADQMVDTADDYTEFNGDYPVRIDGKALNLRMWEAFSSDGSKSMLGDMTNAKVQVYGDTAILTYNFVGVSRDKDGKLSPNAAKSTRVYCEDQRQVDAGARELRPGGLEVLIEPAAARPAT